MRRGGAAVLVEDIPEFAWDGEFYFAYCPESDVRRAYTPERFYATLAKMAAIARETRLGGTLTAKIIPFRKIS